MITETDFEKKQIVFVMARDGDKMAIMNDNFVVKDVEGKIRLQCTCYRLFIVYVVGDCSITTPLIRNAKKYGFFLVLLSSGYRINSILGADKDGNTILKKRQYEYAGLGIAKQITKNKINNSIRTLKKIRPQTEAVNEGISLIEGYVGRISECEKLNQLMAYEGLASRVYFDRFFWGLGWNGRQPRLKRDIINSSLDIGYTLLFNFIDALLQCYGFDTYCGVMHRQFYLRKSLVCDIVEPFRVIVDAEVRKARNLQQIQEKDFMVKNGQYQLNWKQSPRYVQFLMNAILDRKQDIFLYVQKYYRSFMKGVPEDQFPMFEV